MLNKAKEERLSREKEAYTWQEFMVELNNSNLIHTPWCKETECEVSVKDRSGIESKEE